MATTKIQNQEMLNLKQMMLDQKGNKPFEIFNNFSRVVGGSRKHQRVANYLINLLSKNNFEYKTEVRVYFKKISKSYRLDILASKKNKQIAIECGNVSLSKLQHLRNYFEVIHLSYSDFKTLISAEKIKNNLGGIIQNG